MTVKRCVECGNERQHKARGLCVRCYGRMTQRKNRDKAQFANQVLKFTALTRYGGFPPSCACCGELHPDFLTIDHLAGGGNKHRKEIGGNIYSYLKREGYPKGFRVLCMNCNFAIGLFGECPHKTTRMRVYCAVSKDQTTGDMNTDLKELRSYG